MVSELGESALEAALRRLHSERLSGDLAAVGGYGTGEVRQLARTAPLVGAKFWLFNALELLQDQSAPAGGATAEITRMPVFPEMEIIETYFPEKGPRQSDGCNFALAFFCTPFRNSIIGGLQYVYPRLVTKGFIVVKGYGRFTEIANAVDLFFADKSEGVIPMPDFGRTAVARRNQEV
jgi:hypothetical protein